MTLTKESLQQSFYLIKFWFETLPEYYKKVIKHSTYKSELYYFLFNEFNMHNICNHGRWNGYTMYNLGQGKILTINLSTVEDMKKLIHDAVQAYYNRTTFN